MPSRGLEIIQGILQTLIAAKGQDGRFLSVFAAKELVQQGVQRAWVGGGSSCSR